MNHDFSGLNMDLLDFFILVMFVRCQLVLNLIELFLHLAKTLALSVKGYILGIKHSIERSNANILSPCQFGWHMTPSELYNSSCQQCSQPDLSHLTNSCFSNSLQSVRPMRVELSLLRSCLTL
jgi:hypothetical protein